MSRESQKRPRGKNGQFLKARAKPADFTDAEIDRLGELESANRLMMSEIVMMAIVLGCAGLIIYTAFFSGYRYV